MATTRRQFLAGSSAFLGASALGLSTRALADALREQGHPPTLVAIYLRGGADPMNTIVPAGDSEYYKLRPTIAIPARSQDPENPGVLPVTDLFGLHPALAPIMPLYRDKKLAPIICTGSTHPTRSHFDAQDFMERAAPGIKSVTEGWLNRYLSATSSSKDRSLRAVSMQPTLPRSLRGQYPVLAVPVGEADRAMDAFEKLYSCEDNAEAMQRNQSADKPADQTAQASETQTKVAHASAPAATAAEQVNRDIVDAGSQSIEKLRELSRITAGQRAANYPDSPLADRLSRIAKLIKAGQGLEVAAIDYGGWDHHAYQGASGGTMGRMLDTLAKAIRAFHDDLGSHMDKTLVLVMSEFGRTVKENGTYGTDHGHGGFMLASGGMVNGGGLYGNWTGLDQRRLHHGRDLPVHVDFRVVFAEALQALFGFNTDQADFFPQYEANRRPLGYLRPIAK